MKTKRVKDATNLPEPVSSGAGNGPAAKKTSARGNSVPPLSTRILDYESRIADLLAKIRELEETRAALASMLRDLETKESRIERIHHSWMAIFDAVLDPIFMHDRQGRVVRANLAYAEHAGMAIRDVIGRFYWECFPRRVAPLNCCMDDADETTKVFEEEIRLDSGQVFLSRAFPVRDDVDAECYYVHILKDHSESLRAAEALRRERDFISAVLLISSALVVVLDRDGRIVRFNTACEKATGYTESEVRGKAVWDLLIGPDEFESVKNMFHELLANPVAKEHENFWVAKDGQRRRIMWSNTVLPDEHGQTEYIVSTGKDVTEQRRTEAELRDSEARYRSLIENSSDIVTFLDRDGIARYTSPSIERLLGYGQDELVGQNVFTLVHPDDLPRLQQAFARAVENPSMAQHAEHRFKDKDGVWRYLESFGKSLHDDSAAGGLVVNSRDIGARKHMEESLRKANRALRTLSACNESLVHAMDEGELLNAICETIVTTGGYRFAWVGYAERNEEKSVRPIAHAGHEVGYLQSINASWNDNDRGRGPLGTAIRTGTPCVTHDISADPHFLPWREEALRRGYASCIALPLRAKETNLGGLAIYAAEPEAFDGDETRLLMELANDLTYGIIALRTRAERERAMEENRRNAAKLQKALLETVEAMGSALEKRDPYTAGHQRRVAKLARAVAQEMKLPRETVEGIYMGGLIHDIGKIYVPAEILNRPGRLNEAEFNLIRTHSQVGYDIIKGIEFPWPVAQMVLQHHERLNGSGYPQGLKGEAICPEARIMAVADVVEAISSHRPYRPGLGLDKALDQIAGNRGILYDADAVDACVRLFREKGFTFES